MIDAANIQRACRNWRLLKPERPPIAEDYRRRDSTREAIPVLLARHGSRTNRSDPDLPSLREAIAHVSEELELGACEGATGSISFN